MLNTSFNLHGELIVQTPADAARVFKEGGIEVLVLNGYTIEKNSDHHLESLSAKEVG